MSGAERVVRVEETSLPGVLIVEPPIFRDGRGFFVEFFNARRFREHGLPTHFAQDNHSRSVRGTLRGLHYQLDHPQGKLVRVMRGEAFDVAVDIRVGSPWFGQWVGMRLHEDDLRCLWIPPGFAHGFCALSDVVDFTYKCTDVYHADDDRGIHWADPALGIEWPVDAPILSDKDRAYLPLDLSRTDLPRFDR